MKLDLERLRNKLTEVIDDNELIYMSESHFDADSVKEGKQELLERILGLVLASNFTPEGWVNFDTRHPTPEESDQGLAFLFPWAGGPQVAGGTFHDGKPYQDGGDLESEIRGATHFCVLPPKV